MSQLSRSQIEKSTLTERVETRRIDATSRLDPVRRRRLGQFLTPAPVAEFMASLVESDHSSIRILDPGAGVGSLLATAVDDLCGRRIRPTSIDVIAVEIDPALREDLAVTLAEVGRRCSEASIRFRADIVDQDFLEYARLSLESQISFDAIRKPSFDLVLLNPPYSKIRNQSPERRLLARLGVETTNLYAAFLALSSLLLSSGGQLVAITPRSFCNGPYFRAFRRLFLDRMTFTRIHVIESRNEAFANDGVLQENIIFRAVRDQERGNVIVTGGSASHEGHRFGRELAYDVLVVPDDPDAFIHLAPEPAAQDIADRMRRLPSELSDLGLSVSTGRVVDFRARRYLSSEPVRRSVPLIYPAHFEAGFVTWPKKGKKPNAIISTPETSALLVPTGHYVLVKRFSAKEESRRIVAAVCTPARFSQAKTLGFENHLNYFHEEGQGMEPELALGLAAFLNSTNVDQFFRQFSGHTQVNARDLRKLRYPARSVLLKLGSRIQDVFPSQAELDCIVEQELDKMRATVA